MSRMLAITGPFVDLTAMMPEMPDTVVISVTTRPTWIFGVATVVSTAVRRLRRASAEADGSAANQAPPMHSTWFSTHTARADYRSPQHRQRRHPSPLAMSVLHGGPLR